MPRSFSPRLRNNSSDTSKAIDITIKHVATARIVGLIFSRSPENIFQGIVRCLKDPTNRTTTTSSKDVMKANKPPETTPGSIIGNVTRKNAITGLAPRLAAARNNVVSNPTNVAVTVITTKGVPSAAWDRMTPI